MLLRHATETAAPTKVVMRIEGQYINMKDFNSSCSSPSNPIAQPLV